MRQLGVRPPELPPVETDMETPSEILPHERFGAESSEPVEVHRVEWNSVEAESVAQPQETVAADADASPVPLPEERFALEEREPVQVYRIERNPMNKEERAARPRKPVSVDTPPSRLPERSNPHLAPVPFPEPSAAERAPIGRWEEFHESRNAEPKLGGRLRLEPVPVRQDSSSKLLTADLERENRSSFLTLAVPGIAALLAFGALLWSGSLRYRVRQQDAAMSALQEQNQKLVETLTQMSAEQKDSSAALDASPDVPQNPSAATPPATSADGNSKAGAQPEKAQSEHRQTKNRQGVSVPPPVQPRGAASAPRKGEGYRQPVDAGHAPEIVPPYPTNFQPGNVAVNAANSQPVPSGGTYTPPFTPGTPSSPGANQQSIPVAGSGRPATTATTAPRPSVPQASAPSRLPAAPPPTKTTAHAAPAAAPESTTQYQATGNGAYASPLAQNIEAVEGLQRHSPVQLKEFHGRAGASSQATPNVRLSVQNPDQDHGSYTLVVDERGSSHQLRGQVNHPLVFTDTATHREYALVVLSIADQQVYGYVRAAQ